MRDGLEADATESAQTDHAHGGGQLTLCDPTVARCVSGCQLAAQGQQAVNVASGEGAEGEGGGVEDGCDTWDRSPE